MLFVEIVAPDKHIFSSEATRFVGPGVEGSFEVLYNHAPLMAATTVGPVVVTTASGERVTFASSGGFVQVLENRVIMLSETAEPASEIDVERAQKAEERARAKLAHAEGEERKDAEAALERARNRVRVAMGQVGTKTISEDAAPGE
jgi:F-type H+-transporting ATPase subunit epsilon